MASNFVLGIDLQIQKVLGLENVKSQLAGISVGQGTGQGLGQTQAQLSSVAVAASAIPGAINDASNAIKGLGQQSQSTVSNINKLSPTLSQGSKAAQNFGDQVFLAGRRYGAFIAATAVAFKGVELLGAGTEAVIGFDQSVIQLSQILVKTPDQIEGLTQKILDLSVQTGTAATEISRVARVLAQAGFGGTQLEELVTQLAKVPLAPTFENVDQAIAGIIPALKQFNTEGLTAENVLDKLTATERAFAASAPDIATGISRAGSAFQALGGTLDEFIAAFVTIRDVTQESASSVGVALKTISSRLASPEILKFFESRGIKLIEEGQFVGPLEAFKKIGEALETIVNVQDKVEIANKLGGQRQLSRVLALVQNIDKVNAALEISKNSAGAFAQTTEQGLEAIRVKMNQLIANAQKLAIELGPDIFKPFLESLINSGNAAIELLRVLKPLLPIVAQIGAVFATGGILTAGRSLAAAALQKTAPFQAAAAAGAATPGFNAFIGGSPFAQAGLLVAAGQVTASFLKLAVGSDSLAASFISTLTTLTAAITLFRGQTLTQFLGGGGLLPSLGKLGGALATTGILAGAVFTMQAKSAVEEAAGKIINAAIESVKKIPIDATNIKPGDTQQLKNAFVELNNTLAKSITSFVDSFDAFDPNIGFGETITRVFASFGRTVEGIFTGNFERATHLGVSTKDVQEQVSKILDANKGVLNNLTEAFAKSISGTDLAKGIPSYADLQTELLKQVLGTGISTEAAIILTDNIIEAAGGAKEFAAKIIESTEAIKLQIEATSKLSDLTKQFITPGLTGQLFNFDKAFKTTTQSLQSSANRFKDQFSLVTGIGAGNITGNFGLESVRQNIVSGNFSDLFQNTPGIPKFVGGINDIKNVLDDFVNFASQSGDTLKATDFDAVLDTFFNFRNNVPKVIQDNFRQVLTEVGRLMADSAGTDVPLEKVRESFKNTLQKFGSDLSNTVVEQIGQLAELSIQRIERNLDAFSNIQKLRLETAITPASQARLLQQLLSETGISTGNIGAGQFRQPGTLEQLQEQKRRERGFLTPEAPPGFFIGGANQALIETITGGPVREELRNKFLELTQSVSDTRNQLSTLDFGSQQFEDVTNKLQNLSTELIRVQTAFEALNKASNEARQARLEEVRSQGELRLQRFREETQQMQALGVGFNAEGRQREEFNIQQENAKQQRDVNEEFDRIIEKDAQARLDAATIIEQNTRDQRTTTQIFQSSVDSFSQAVLNFKTFQEEAQGPTTLSDFSKLVAQNAIDEATATRFLDRIISTGGIDNSTKQQQETTKSVTESDANNQNNQQQIAGLLENIAQSTNANVESSKNIETSISNLQSPSDAVRGDMQAILDRIVTLEQRLITEQKFKIDTDQKVQIDITGITDTIRGEVEPLLRDAAHRAAKSVITDTLRSLANRSNDPESAAIFNQLSTELESNS